MTQARQEVPFWIWALLGIVGLVFIGASFRTIYNDLTDGSTDMYSSWTATRLYLKEGISPYDERVAQEAQMGLFGRLARPDEDQFLNYYPFYIVFYLAPIALLDYQLAAAIYMEVLLLGLLLAFVLNLRVLRWLPSPIMLGTLLLFSFTSYFSVRGFLLAQHAIVGYVGHMIALWAIFRGHDKVAGVALGISTIRPQTGYLTIPLILLWAWQFRRYSIIWSFVGTMGVLFGASFLLYPPWLSEYLAQIPTYQETTQYLAAAEIVTHILPNSIEDAAQILLTIGLAIPVLIGWKRLLVDRNDQNFLWIYCMTMAFGLIVPPRIATTYYIDLYPALYAAALVMTRRKQQLWIYLIGIIFIVGYWVLHVTTLPPAPIDGSPGKESNIVIALFPMLMVGLLLLFRNAFPAFDDLNVKPEPSAATV
jgi:hypothetical protein